MYSLDVLIQELPFYRILRKEFQVRINSMVITTSNTEHRAEIEKELLFGILAVGRACSNPQVNYGTGISISGIHWVLRNWRDPKLYGLV